MSTGAKLITVACGLVLLFAVAFGVGRIAAPAVAGQVARDPVPSAHDDTHGGATDPATGVGHGGHAAAVDPVGLAVERDGHRLALDQRVVTAGPSQSLTFRIEGPDGRPVTTYTKAHDKDLHLIVVRRDLTGFQHVHPVLDGTGTWRTTVDLTSPGEWRVIADFDPAGDAAPMTLGTDLHVGAWTPAPLGEPSRTSTVDGYTVTLAGDLTPGEESQLTLSVSRDGTPVTDLQPYLAAYGHLVALRDGDLAYLHVHPDGAPGDGATKPGPTITFHTTAPSAGGYRLSLDFQHAGVVRTATFTLEAGAGHGH